jgi:hypothetical protein
MGFGEVDQKAINTIRLLAVSRFLTSFPRDYPSIGRLGDDPAINKESFEVMAGRPDDLAISTHDCLSIQCVFTNTCAG